MIRKKLSSSHEVICTRPLVLSLCVQLTSGRSKGANQVRCRGDRSALRSFRQPPLRVQQRPYCCSYRSVNVHLFLSILTYCNAAAAVQEALVWTRRHRLGSAQTDPRQKVSYNLPFKRDPIRTFSEINLPMLFVIQNRELYHFPVNGR